MGEDEGEWEEVDQVDEAFCFFHFLFSFSIFLYISPVPR